MEVHGEGLVEAAGDGVDTAKLPHSLRVQRWGLRRGRGCQRPLQRNLEPFAGGRVVAGVAGPVGAGGDVALAFIFVQEVDVKGHLGPVHEFRHGGFGQGQRGEGIEVLARPLGEVLGLPRAVVGEEEGLQHGRQERAPREAHGEGSSAGGGLGSTQRGGSTHAGEQHGGVDQAVGASDAVENAVEHVGRGGDQHGGHHSVFDQVGDVSVLRVVASRADAAGCGEGGGPGAQGIGDGRIGLGGAVFRSLVPARFSTTRTTSRKITLHGCVAFTQCGAVLVLLQRQNGEDADLQWGSCGCRGCRRR